jgi:hypothetical protein
LLELFRSAGFSVLERHDLQIPALVADGCRGTDDLANGSNGTDDLSPNRVRHELSERRQDRNSQRDDRHECAARALSPRWFAVSLGREFIDMSHPSSDIEPSRHLTRAAAALSSCKRPRDGRDRHRRGGKIRRVDGRMN